MLEDFLNRLAAERGQVSLATSKKIDPSTFNKFLSHTGAMKLRDIDHLLMDGNAVIVDKHYIDMLRQTIRNLGALLNEKN